MRFYDHETWITSHYFSEQDRSTVEPNSFIANDIIYGLYESYDENDKLVRCGTSKNVYYCVKSLQAFPNEIKWIIRASYRNDESSMRSMKYYKQQLKRYYQGKRTL